MPSIIAINILVWILSSGSIVGIGYGTYLLLEEFTGEINNLKVMSLSAYVTAIMMVVPTFFKWFGYLAQVFGEKIRQYQDYTLSTQKLLWA